MYKSCYKVEMQSAGIFYKLPVPSTGTQENDHGKHVDQIQTYFWTPPGIARTFVIFRKEEITVLEKSGVRAAILMQFSGQSGMI